MIWESNILLKFLFGKCSEKEAGEVKVWLSESEHNKQTLLQLKSNVINQL
jgi:hypothetical protein